MVNRATLIGRLGNDLELRYTQKGTACCNLRIATNSFYNGQQQTEWHRVTVWGKTAENCAQYLSKGRQVYVEGSIRTRQWTDKSNNTRYTTEIHAAQVMFLGNATKQQEAKQQTELELAPEATLPSVTEEAQQVFNTPVGDDDSPF